MELVFLYVWLKLNSLISLSIVLAIGGTLIYALLWCISQISISDAHDEVRGYREDKDKTSIETPKQKAKREWKAFFSGRLRFIPRMVVACTLFSAFSPNATETAVLVAGHYALQFSNSEEGKKVKTLIQLTANNMLDDAIKSATKK